MAKNKVENEMPAVEQGELTALLIALREKAGYSRAQMAEAMCLSEETIRQLENEDFDALAEPPYVRGYLRNYAKQAETDSEELITLYESLRGADPSDLNYHFKTSAKILSNGNKRSMSPVIMQLIFLALLLGALVAASMIPAVNDWVKKTWSSFSNQAATQSSISSDNPLLTGTMPVPTPLPDEVPPPENKAPEPTVTDKPVATTSEAVVENKTETTAETPTENNEESNKDLTKTTNTPDATPPPTNDVASDGTIKLKLIFNKEVWMRIRNDKKKTVFEGQNASGQEKELSLKKPLTFRVGNAQGLSLFVDGKPVDISSYIKGSVANFTLE
jgi:cytoskeletal protein RodZ